MNQTTYTSILGLGTGVALSIALVRQCRRPSGWLTLRRGCLPLLVCLVVAIAVGRSAAENASDLQFDKTRLWVEAGVASGLADSGQTRFSLSLGGAWYLEPWLGIGLGVGLTDVYDSPGFLGVSYHVRAIPVFAQCEVIPWRTEAFNVFCSADVGVAWWWTSYGSSTEFGSIDHAYGGAHLAVGVGARHRRPNSRVGMFTQVKYWPEVGPEVAWPLFSVTIGLEG